MWKLCKYLEAAQRCATPMQIVIMACGGGKQCRRFGGFLCTRWFGENSENGKIKLYAGEKKKWLLGDPN